MDSVRPPGDCLSESRNDSDAFVSRSMPSIHISIFPSNHLDSEEMIFQYAHLLKGSIRLARFHPDSTPANVSLTLVHEARYFDPTVHYTALAYESQEPCVEMSEILLQGRTRRVPRTVWQALSAVVEHHDTSGLFWIYYVCVKQNDDGEVSDHRARIPSIYAAADEVLLWLGSGDAIARAGQDVAANGTHSPDNEMPLQSSKDSFISPSILERFQLQQAKRVVLLQGKSLAEVKKPDPHSAL